MSALLTTGYSQQLLKTLLRHMQQQGFQLSDTIKLYQEAKGEGYIPLSIFATKLPPAEAVCKYLRENKQLSYREIAERLHRDSNSVWANYQRSRKTKVIFPSRPERYIIPLSLFEDRMHSILEIVVSYVHDTYRLSNPQMAKLLHKSPNSIAVIAKRARDINEQQ